MGRFLIGLSVVWAAFAASAQVEVGPTKIVVSENIYFENGKDKIEDKSLPLLRKVAKALAENPRFTKVTIEGHTDSRGKAQANKLLSEKRAKAVRRFLIAEGVASKRLTTKGFGDTHPLESNTTAAGRARNRRVMFVVYGIRGKGVPLAKISARKNIVETREPEGQKWEQAQVGTGLYKQWRVQSRERSSADITFRDASKIHLREDTLVIVYGPQTERTRRMTSIAELERGALRTRLDELSGARVLVKTPGAEAEFDKGRGMVSVDEKGSSIIANHGGEPVLVRGLSNASSNKRVKVKDNYGSKVVKSKAPQRPRLLPKAPVLSPENPKLFAAPNNKATVFGSWSSVKEAQEYHVELVRKADDIVVAAATVPASVERFEIQGIEAGSFSMRVSTVDNERFESKPSEPADFEVLLLSVEGGSKGAFYRGARLSAPPGGLCRWGKGQALNTITLPSVESVEVRCVNKDQAEIAGLTIALDKFDFKAASLETKRKKQTQWRFAIPQGFDDKGWSLVLPEGVTAGSARVNGAELMFDITSEKDAPKSFKTTLMREGVEVQSYDIVAPPPLVSYTTYKTLHLISILMLFMALGGAIFMSLAGANKKGPRVLNMIIHGVFVLLVLVGGFGLMARLGVSHKEGWPLWLKVKLGLWLLISGFVLVPRRLPKINKFAWPIVVLLGFLAVYMAVHKPA